jgi:hypothetical protein
MATDDNIIANLGSNCERVIQNGVQEELLTGLVQVGAHIRARELVAPTSAALREATERRDRAAADLTSWQAGKERLEENVRQLQARVILERDPQKKALLEEGLRDAQHAVFDYHGGDSVLRSRLNDARRDVARLSGALEVLQCMAARRPDTGLLDKVLKG